MQKSYFEKATEIINQNSQFNNFVGSRPDSLIEKGELRLGLKFPPSYREFLKKYGAGYFAGESYYGLIGENFEDSGHPDGIWLNISSRSYGVPNHLVIVNGLGEGTEFAIDTSKPDQKGECPIVAVPIGYQGGFDLEVIANSFGEFFYNTIQEAINRRKNPPPPVIPKKSYVF